jgi:drug/metabolite transporter superfamily protein YnfA
MDLEDLLGMFVAGLMLLLLFLVILLPTILTFIAGTIYAIHGSTWVVFLLLFVAIVIQLLKS